jgi:hypothetical protein
VEICDPVIHHERSRAWGKVVATSVRDVPDRRARSWIAVVVGPAKCCAAPSLNVNAKMFLVPDAQCIGIIRFEEDTADTRDSLHVNLRRIEQS